MARLYTSGFEFGHNQAEGLTVVGSAAFQTGTVRTGARAGSTPGAIDYFKAGVVSTAGRRYWLRGAFYVTATPVTNDRYLTHVFTATHAFWTTLSTAGEVELWAFTDSVVQLATTAVVPSLNAWHVLELDWMIPASGDLQLGVWLDGTEIIPRAAFTVANEQSEEVVWGNNNSAGTAGGNCYWDDIALNDDQGASQNTRPGDGRVFVLRPASDPGTSSGNWQKPGGGTTNRHTSLDNVPPVYETYDSTSASAEDYTRNAVNSANAELNVVTGTYTAAGIDAGHQIALVQPVANTGSSSATNTAGDVGSTANPVVAQASFAAFDNGIASATATTWPLQVGTVAYVPTVTRGTGSTLQVRKVTGTTRVAIVNALGLLVESRPPILVSGGVAAETDSAPAGAARKRVAGATAAEMDTAPAGSVSMPTVIAGGTAAETNTAPAGTGSKPILIAGGIASEIDTTSAGAASKQAQGGVAPEADTALVGSVSKPIIVAGGAATETDAVPAGFVLKPIVVAGDVALEADTALAGTATKLVAGEAALEADTALAGSAGQAQLVQGDVATETDTVPAGAATKLVTADVAVETDSALAGAASRSVDGATAAETDTALEGSSTKDVAGGAALEADLALGGSTGQAQVVQGGVALEADTALGGAVSKLATAGAAGEADTTLAGAPERLYAAATAAEADSALGGAIAKTVTSGTALEVDTAPAGSSGQAQTISGGVAAETDTAPAGTVTKSVVVGTALEVDAALGGTVERMALAGVATEADTAPAGTAIHPIIVAGGIAAETDTVPAPSVIRLVPGIAATEIDEAPAGTSHQTVLGGVGAELDAALEGQVLVLGAALPTPRPYRVRGGPRVTVAATRRTVTSPSHATVKG